jgi:hypothetical protein
MSDLLSPMSSRPVPDAGKGGSMPGDKDGIEALKGAVAGSLNSPMAAAPVKQPGASTAGGPVGLQVTEDVQGIVGKRGSFPTGTGSRV